MSLAQVSGVPPSLSGLLEAITQSLPDFLQKESPWIIAMLVSLVFLLRQQGSISESLVAQRQKALKQHLIFSPEKGEFLFTQENKWIPQKDVTTLTSISRCRIQFSDLLGHQIHEVLRVWRTLMVATNICKVFSSVILFVLLAMSGAITLYFLSDSTTVDARNYKWFAWVLILLPDVAMVYCNRTCSRSRLKLQELEEQAMKTP